MQILAFIGGVVFMLIGASAAYLLGYQRGIDASTKHMLYLLQQQQRSRPKSFQDRLDEELKKNNINQN